MATSSKIESGINACDRRYARASAAASYFKIGRSTLYEWCRTRASEGFPQPLKVGPRVALFDLDALEAFMGARA
jgi:predicted DNA-binding transcriptional regulator AlpA